MFRLFAFAAIVLTGLSSASAQTYAQPGASSGLPASNNTMLNMYGNAAYNPYLNPYLNPLVTGQGTNPNNALLYLWSAQQMPGGLMAPQATSSPAPRAAEMHRSGQGPAGGASRYFSRTTPNKDGSAHYYQRTNRYFGNNGR